MCCSGVFWFVVVSAEAVVAKSLQFQWLGALPGKRTDRWRVLSARTGVPLGMVEFRSTWRQYVFVPGERTLFAADCMMEVAEFLTQLKEERAVAAAKKKKG